MKVAILDMFEGFPSSTVSTSTARVYHEAAEGCSLKAVQRTALEYRKGRVPNQNKKFAPSSAEFGERCRLIDDALTFYEANKDRLALPPPAPPEIDPAMRKRVSGLLLDLAGKMGEKVEAEKRVSDKKVFGRTNAEDMGDPRSLDERLRLA